MGQTTTSHLLSDDGGTYDFYQYQWIFRKDGDWSLNELNWPDKHLCEHHSDCNSNHCNRFQHCGKRDDKQLCETDSDCTSNICNSFDECGKRNDEQACKTDSDCNSNHCNSFDQCG